jgi:hypothetical protein
LKKVKLLLLVCIVLVSLSACSKDNVLPHSSPAPTQTSTPIPSHSPIPTQTPTLKLADDNVKDILKGLIPKAVNIYGIFNGTEALKFDETKTIPDDKEYLLVTGEKIKMGLFDNVKSMSDFKNVIEGIFTKDTAEKLFYSRYLEIMDDGSKNRPYYKGYEGQLYIYKWMGGHGSAQKFLTDTAKLIKQNNNIAEVELDTTLFDKPDDKLTLTIEYVNDKWLLASSLVPVPTISAKPSNGGIALGYTDNQVQNILQKKDKTARVYEQPYIEWYYNNYANG